MIFSTVKEVYMKGTFEKKEHFVLTGKRVHGFIGYPPMFHPHCELIYVVKGSIRTVVDGCEHQLTAGELTLVFPYQTHSYDNSPDAEVIIILFSPSAIAFDNTLITKKPLCHYTDGSSFYTMIDRAVVLIRSGKTKTALGYINAVIGELLEIMRFESVTAIEEDTAVKILEYCTEHFCENISVKSISEALYISQSYISKIFSNKLKCNFREYINILRIEKAKTMLETSDGKIVDIMLECGFENQSSFNRVFKDICDVTPNEYRNNLHPKG